MNPPNHPLRYATGTEIRKVYYSVIDVEVLSNYGTQRHRALSSVVPLSLKSQQMAADTNLTILHVVLGDL